MLEVSRRGPRVTLRVRVSEGEATVDVQPGAPGVRAFLHQGEYAIGYRGDSDPGVAAARWVSDRLSHGGLEERGAPPLASARPPAPEPLAAIARFAAHVGGAPPSLGLELATLRRGSSRDAVFELSVRVRGGDVVSGPRVTRYQESDDSSPALATMAELLGPRASELAALEPRLGGLGAHASASVSGGVVMPKLYLTAEAEGASAQLREVARALGGRPWPERSYVWLGVTFTPDGLRRVRLYEARRGEPTPPGADPRTLRRWDDADAPHSSATYYTFLGRPLELEEALDSVGGPPALRERLARAFGPHTCRVLARGSEGEVALYAHAGPPRSTGAGIRGPLKQP